MQKQKYVTFPWSGVSWLEGVGFGTSSAIGGTSEDLDIPSSCMGFSFLFFFFAFYSEAYMEIYVCLNQFLSIIGAISLNCNLNWTNAETIVCHLSVVRRWLTQRSGFWQLISNRWHLRRFRHPSSCMGFSFLFFFFFAFFRKPTWKFMCVTLCLNQFLSIIGAISLNCNLNWTNAEIIVCHLSLVR